MKAPAIDLNGQAHFEILKQNKTKQKTMLKIPGLQMKFKIKLVIYEHTSSM